MSAMIDDMRAFADSARNGGCCEGGRCSGSTSALEAHTREQVKKVFAHTSKPEMRSILEEAAEIMSVDRQASYGHPLENHERIVGLWNVFLGGKLKAPIEPREAAWMMILLKVAREMNCPRRDNLVDTVGYAAVIEVIDKARAESQ